MKAKKQSKVEILAQTSIDQKRTLSKKRSTMVDDMDIK